MPKKGSDAYIWNCVLYRRGQWEMAQRVLRGISNVISIERAKKIDDEFRTMGFSEWLKKYDP